MRSFFHKTYHRIILENFLRAESGHVRGDILDIGSKSRRYDSFFSGKVAAVDLQENLDKNIKFGDVEKGLDFSDGAFTGIICLEVFEYLKNPSAAAAEIHRLLSTGGVAVVSVPFLYHEHDDRIRLTEGGLKDVLSGFSEVKIKKIGNAWVVIWDILRKKMLASRNPLLWIFLGPILMVLYVLLRYFKLDTVEDKYYSGLFAVLKK